MRPIASVMAGALIACWIFFLCISIAVVMLGALAPHLVPYGIGMSLSCAIFLMVSYTIFAPARSKMIAVPTIISAVMLSAILADVLGVFTDLAIVTSLDRMLLSFVAFATIFIGVAFLVLRFTSLGNVARYIPLPVMNGFLLAVIWIGFKGVIDYSTGHDDAFASLASFTDIFTVEISNGIILCVALMFASQFFRAHRVLPLLLLFVIYVDYFIVNFAVTDSVSSDYQKTWLANLDSIPFNTSAIFNISELPRQVFNATIPDLLAMSLILFILSIYFASLYTSSLARSQLTAPAVGNFLAGVLGNGPPGISSRITHGVLNTRGVSFRVATVTAACILVVAAFWGHHFLAIVPVYIAYGVSLYMLSDLLFNWILANVTKSKLIDTSLAASIGFISIAYGFQVSIPVGTVLSAIIFVRQYSRVTVFRTIFDCTWFHSSTDYSEAEFQTLQAKGKSVIGFILQNFLFYGAEHQLLSRIQKDIDDVDSEVEIILLDFTNVQGFDSTVFIGFQNFFNLINVLGAQLVLTGLSDRVQQTMLQSIAPSFEEKVTFYPTLDQGVRYCERLLLRAKSKSADGKEDDVKIDTWLVREMESVEDASAIIRELKQQQFLAGQPLIVQDSTADSMFFIVSGGVEIIIEAPNQRPIRLRSIKAGNITGEIGFYTRSRRTATVVADTETTAYVMYRDSYDKLLEENPRALKSLNQMVILNLARNLSRNNQALRQLL